MNRNRQIKPETTEITIDGIVYILGKSAEEEPLLPGQLYVAERNTGPELLACQKMSNDLSYVIAFPKADGTIPYPYDAWECRKVMDIKNA